MRNLSKPIGWPLAVALAAATLGALPTAVAAQSVAASAQSVTGGSSGVVQVATNRGRMVTLKKPMTDLFVANSEIADVQVRSPTQLYIFGKKAGETTVSATTKGGQVVYAATVRVGNNYDSVGQMLKLAMPEAHITATTMNGLVLLTGTVASPNDGAEAERLVNAFVGDGAKVISRLKTATPLQVNLQVKIVEVSRSFVKNVGVNLGSFDSTSGFKFGIGQGGRGFVPQYTPGGGLWGGMTQGSEGTTVVTNGAAGTTLGLAGRLFGLDLVGALDLGETIGQVSTLANPNLTALSGETATFLVGGEIPIPLSQGLGAVSVEYKQYGVSIAYTPTVLSNGQISLRVRPEVSQLTSEGAVQIGGTTIPALTTRRAETTLVLGSGQSMMIGGLLSNTHNNSIDKAPGLGDLPILGALFRSNSWKRNESELMIVITPYLVKPVDANQIVLPTDGYKGPTDLGRVFMGQLGNGQNGGDRVKPSMVPTAPPSPAAGANAPLLPAPQIDPGAPVSKKRGDDASANPGFSN